MSGWPRKVSSITPRNVETPIEDRMTMFDYSASAELFVPKKGKAGVRQSLSYRRFASAAEAIRFAVEDFPAIRTLGAWMRVGDDCFNGDDIRRLYESDSYPRRHRTRKPG
jgi:Arc/MetJ-type ribon-helix-helix transcriptional regulator